MRKWAKYILRFLVTTLSYGLLRYFITSVGLIPVEVSSVEFFWIGISVLCHLLAIFLWPILEWERNIVLKEKREVHERVFTEEEVSHDWYPGDIISDPKPPKYTVVQDVVDKRRAATDDVRFWPDSELDPQPEPLPEAPEKGDEPVKVSGVLGEGKVAPEPVQRVTKAEPQGFAIREEQKRAHERAVQDAKRYFFSDEMAYSLNMGYRGMQERSSFIAARMRWYEKSDQDEARYDRRTLQNWYEDWRNDHDHGGDYQGKPVPKENDPHVLASLDANLFYKREPRMSYGNTTEKLDFTNDRAEWYRQNGRRRVLVPLYGVGFPEETVAGVESDPRTLHEWKRDWDNDRSARINREWNERQRVENRRLAAHSLAEKGFVLPASLSAEATEGQRLVERLGRR